MGRAGRMRRRRELKGLVDAGDVEAIVAWAGGGRDSAAMLVTRTVEVDDQKRWTATVALAKVAREMEDLEAVREILRRLLWLMNDESGGIAWHGPETIAAVLVHVPELQPEFGRIVASFIREDPFGPGAAWAIGRLAANDPERLGELVPDLEEGVGSPEPFFRASALEALAILRPRTAEKRARLLLEDRASLPSLDVLTGAVSSTTVGEVARRIAGDELSPAEAATGS